MPINPGLQLPFGIQPTNPVPVDAWSGPFTAASLVAGQPNAAVLVAGQLNAAALVAGVTAAALTPPPLVIIVGLEAVTPKLSKT